MAQRDTARGLMELAQLTSAMSSIREASPQDRGAALVAHLSARLAAIERRVQALEARA